MSSVLTAAENFTVVVYKRGSTANGAQSGTLTSITVRNGALKWASGNKGMVGLTPARYFTVNGTPANDTTIPINAVSLSILDGDRLVNLGADTGGGTPNFDGSGVSIYAVNSDGASAISQSRVTTDGHGEYAYYVAAVEPVVDELILSGTTPVELIEDVQAGSPHRVMSPEPNAASAVGHVLDTEHRYTTAGAKLLSLRSDGVEQSSFDKDGRFAGGVDATTITASTITASDLTVQDQATIQGPLIAQGTLAVTGATTLTGALAANGGVASSTITGTTITASSSLVSSGGLDVVGAITQTLAGSTNAITGRVRLANNVAGFGGFYEMFAASEELNLAGVSVKDSTANLLPANSLILCVTARVTATITGGGVTAWSVGDVAEDQRFISDNGTLTAGTTAVGLNHWKGSVATEALGPTQSTDAVVRVDVVGGTAATGRIRVTVFYMAFVPSTS